MRSHDGARALIDALTRSAHDGALLVLGAAGSGKTGLLAQALASHAEEAVLVPVNRGESGWPLSGLAAVVAAVGGDRTAGFVGRFTLRDDDEAALGDAAAELLGLLRGLDLPRTLLLVDDIDRMDGLSRAIVGYMAGHLTGSGIRIVATAVELVDDEPLAGLPSIELGRVHDDDADRLAPPGIDAGTLQLVRAAAGGNLGALTRLFDTLTPEQLTGREALRLPPRPGPAAWAALEHISRRLGQTHLATIDRLATAPLHQRAAVAHWPDEAEDALQELLDLGVARETGAFVTLADPLVRAAASDALPSRARRELHAELAEGCGPLFAPWHASWVDPSREFGPQLLDAAATLARLGHPLAGAEFAERAIRSGGDGLGGALATVADALLAAGEPALTDRYLGFAAAAHGTGPDDAVRLETARLRADLLAGRGDDRHTVVLDGVDPDVAARWLATRAAVDAVRGEPAGAAHEPAEGSPETRALAATARALSLGGSAPDMPVGDVDPLVLALRARAAIVAEDYAGARALVARLTRRLTRPNRTWDGWIASLAIDVAERAGHLGEAVELAREWEARHPGAAGPATAVPFASWARLGELDLDAADAVLESWTDAVAPRVGPLPTARGLTLRAEIARLRGDEPAACELLELADTLTPAGADPRATRHLPELVEALAALDRITTARGAAERLTAAVAAHPSRWGAHAVARALVATAESGELRRRFAEAEAVVTPGDDRFQLGKLHLVYARRLAQAGEASDAERAASTARILFTGAGARAWARAASHLVAPALGAGAASADSPRPGPLDRLTPDERQVVELVVKGLQNKEIAATLYVSVRTVELRLTRSYRKLGARSRAHLVALLS